jgi:prepilin-type N-terminal cleavage/methylation domain-containing protein
MLFKRGFTIVEIMVVVTVMSILAGVIVVASLDSGKQSRDTERQADLRALQTAVELYKLKNGRYPEGCNGPSSATVLDQNSWSGQIGTNFVCNLNNGIYASYVGTGEYIIGLAPEFIPTLPTDPKLSSTTPTNSGYVYAVNLDGTVFKIMALNTVETEVVSTNHQLYRCGTGDITSAVHECQARPTGFGGSAMNSTMPLLANTIMITQFLEDTQMARLFLEPLDLMRERVS